MKTLTRRQVNEAKNKILRKRSAKIKGKLPARDAKYLVFVRNLFCAVHISSWYRGWLNGVVRIEELQVHWWGKEKSQACHMGPHGISQKASDYTCVPLCAKHHEEIGSSIKKLEALGIDYAALAAKLRSAYEAQR